MTAGKKAILLSVTCLGMSSLITQIVTLREFMNILAGNELVLGLVLGNWLLLTGVGTFLGRFTDRLRNPLFWLVAAQVAIGLLPLAQVAAIRRLSSFFMPGLLPGLNDTFLLSLLLLSPYCIVSGILLTLFAGLGGERRDASQIGEVYVLDVLGDILGGIAFSFLLVYFLSTYQTLILLMALNLSAASLVGGMFWGRKAAAPVAALLGCCIAFAVVADLETVTSRPMFPGQEIVSRQSTPYGQLVTTRSERLLSVYANGIVIGTSENIMAAEESVHYGLAQHPAPDRILLVSGGLNGVLREAAKYPVPRIDYVELDPAAVELVRRYALPADFARINLIAQDARRFVRSKRNAYDAVLVDLPDPSTALLNRFYTVEFFREVKSALREGGVFSFSMSGAENYATPEISYLAGTVYRSLASVFPNILLIPGQNQFYIASDRPLGYDIAARLAAKKIATSYVTDDYLRAKLTPDRMAAARAMIETPGRMNLDFRPAGYYMLMRHWLAQFQASLLVPLLLVGGIALAIMVLVTGAPGRPTQLAVCGSGFTGLGLEVVLIVAFQICYGYVYQQMGIIITGFLLGTALGGAWSVRRPHRSRSLMLRLDLLLAATSLGLALLLPALKDSALLQSPAPLPSLFFAALTALIGFLVGAQFPLAARLTFQKIEQTAGNLYALDYLGAALGGLVIAAFAIPLLGIPATCVLLGTVKLVTSALLWLQRCALLPTTGRPGEMPGPAIFPAAASLALFAALGLTICSDTTGTALYALSFQPAYHWTLLLLAAAGLLYAIRPELQRSGPKPLQALSGAVMQRTRISLSRWFNFAVFSVVVFFPLFRCYFKIPYLFCHVCPRQCVFGYLRPYLVPAALIMNLEKRSWCLTRCPLGTLFDCQAHAAGTSRHLPRKAARTVALAVLGFVAYSYFRIEADLAGEAATLGDWYTLFFANRYGPVPLVLLVVAGLVVLSFLVRRPFCDALCPVGTLSDLAFKAEKKVAHPSAANPGPEVLRQ